MINNFDTTYIRWRRDAGADADVDADACEDNDTCLLQIELEVESNYELGGL